MYESTFGHHGRDGVRDIRYSAMQAGCPASVMRCAALATCMCHPWAACLLLGPPYLPSPQRPPLNTAKIRYHQGNLDSYADYQECTFPRPSRCPWSADEALTLVQIDACASESQRGMGGRELLAAAYVVTATSESHVLHNPSSVCCTT